MWFLSLCLYAEPATVRQVFECEASSHEMAMDVLLEKVRQHDSQGFTQSGDQPLLLDGGSESESERPLSIGGADKISPKLFTEFDYIALWAFARPQYKGAEHVRYSGSILKYSFSEQHQHKSVTLVELGTQTPIDIRLLPLTSMRDVRILEGELDTLLAQGKTDAKREDYLMVRLLDKHAILDAMANLGPSTLMCCI